MKRRDALHENAALPGPGRLLLHVCCATCSGVIIDHLCAKATDFTAFFYNPNIHPRDEYERRKADVMRYCDKRGVVYVDGDYDADAWFAHIKGHESAPERGARCGLCFGMRLRCAAVYAAAHGYAFLASSLGISRWKDLEQVNAAGHMAVAGLPGLAYWDCNWRKGGRADRRFAIAKEENFYQQDYCGCIFSRAARDARAGDKESL